MNGIKLILFFLITMGVHWYSSMWLHVACYTCTLLQLRHFNIWGMWPLHRGRHGLISSLLLLRLIVHMVCVYVCAFFFYSFLYVNFLYLARTRLFLVSIIAKKTKHFNSNERRYRFKLAEFLATLIYGYMYNLQKLTQK